MAGRKSNISVIAVRKANRKLVSNSGKSATILSDNSKNGEVAFRAIYRGKAYDLSISKAKIKAAYAKSVAETIL
jgi:stringent starvation protein B